MTSPNADELARAAASLRETAARLEELALRTAGSDVGAQSLTAYRDGMSDQVLARKLLRTRRRIGDFLDPAMFADPARDMLLDLFMAAEEGQPMSASSACIASAVPFTTALRWLDRLRRAGLVAYSADAQDNRRKLVSLTSQGHEAMRGYIRAARAILLADGANAPPPHR